MLADLRRVARFDVQTPSQSGKCGLDLMQTRLVPERKQPLNVRFGYSDTAGKLCFCGGCSPLPFE